MRSKVINLAVISVVGISSLFVSSVGSSANAQTAKPVTDTKPCVRQPLPKLKQDMPYSKAREILLEAGWQAIFNQENFQNPDKFRPIKYFVKKGYTEIVDCAGSGLGLCIFQFESAYGEILSVVTANNMTGKETVFRWYIEQQEIEK